MLSYNSGDYLELNTFRPAIATVFSEGLVTAVPSRSVLINAKNEGAVASIPIQVLLSGDSDGDGLPDDFEIAKSIDPGGPIRWHPPLKNHGNSAPKQPGSIPGGLLPVPVPDRPSP